VKSLSDLTGLFTASIMSGRSWRLPACGMQQEARPNYEPLLTRGLMPRLTIRFLIDPHAMARR